MSRHLEFLYSSYNIDWQETLLKDILARRAVFKAKGLIDGPADRLEAGSGVSVVDICEEKNIMPGESITGESRDTGNVGVYSFQIFSPTIIKHCAQSRPDNRKTSKQETTEVSKL